MLGIMAVMDQKEIFRHVQGLVCWYLTMSLALCSSWLSQAQDARHHGRHGPQDSHVEVHRCSSWTRSLTCPLVCCEWRHGPDSAENCLAIPQVQLLDDVVVPVVCNDNALVLMLRTLEVPQLQFLDKVFLRCSSWTRFSCPLCATTGPRVPAWSIGLWISPGDNSRNGFCTQHSSV